MPHNQRRWTSHEDAVLAQQVRLQRMAQDGDVQDWSTIAAKIPGRSNKDCRKRFYNKVAGGLKKGLWMKEEDEQLKSLVEQHGLSWAAIARNMPRRSAEQCSKRWKHHLNPSIDHSPWSNEENARLLLAVQHHGTAWRDIQQLHFPCRSTNNIKNMYTVLRNRGCHPPAKDEGCCDAAAQARVTPSTESCGSSENKDSPTMESCAGSSRDSISVHEDGQSDINGVSTLSDLLFSLDSPDCTAFPAMSSEEVEMLNMLVQSEYDSPTDSSGFRNTFVSPEIPPDRLQPYSAMQDQDILQYPSMPLEPGYQNGPSVWGNVNSAMPLPASTSGYGGYHPPMDNLSHTADPQPSSARVGSTSTTHIAIDDVDPRTLAKVMDILTKEQSNIRLQTTLHPP